MSIEMKQQGGAYQRTKMPSILSVDRDDILTGDLHIGEEVPFVAAYFGDHTDAYGQMRATATMTTSLEPELSRDGSHVVWVENSRTGELLPVLADSRHEDSSGGNGGDDEQDRANKADEFDENSPLILPKALDEHEEDRNVVDDDAVVANIEQGDSSGHSYAGLFLQGFFLLFQGMLAGFNVISVAFLVLSDETFLKTYQASANEVRRVSFILSTLAALGAVDNLMSLISRSSRPSLSGADTSQWGSNLVTRENSGSFLVAVSACVLYLTSMVLTVLLGGTDTLIYYKFGVDTSLQDWIVVAIADHSARIATWRTLVSARIAVAAFGWACSCFLIWRDLIAKDGRGHELIRLQEVIMQWRHRVQVMEGDSLEGMDSAALRKLVALQSLGYERTNAALRVMDSL